MIRPATVVPPREFDAPVERPLERRLRLGPRDRVLLLAPHPDDEALAAGGLLQQAAEQSIPVRVLYATRGENNPWAQRAHERRWRIREADRVRWGLLRRDEALASLERLGLGLDCARELLLPDQKLTDLMVSKSVAITSALAEEVDRFQPSLFLVPSIRDIHPDHGALGVAALLAMKTALLPTPSVQMLEYIVHKHGAEPAGRVEHPENVLLTAEQRDRKRLAVLCHRTQLHLRRRFLLGFVRDFETFGRVSRGLEWDPNHPVRDLALSEDSLHLEVSPPTAFGWGAPEILLVSERLNGIQGSLRLTFDARANRASARVSWNGADPIPVRVSLARDLVRFRLPLWPEFFSEHSTLFAKVEYPAVRRWGFFDHHGWRRIAVPAGFGAVARSGPSVDGREAVHERA